MDEEGEGGGRRSAGLPAAGGAVPSGARQPFTGSALTAGGARRHYVRAGPVDHVAIVPADEGGNAGCPLAEGRVGIEDRAVIPAHGLPGEAAADDVAPEFRGILVGKALALGHRFRAGLGGDGARQTRAGRRHPTECGERS